MESANGRPETVFPKNPNLRNYFSTEDGEKWSSLSDAVRHSDSKGFDLEGIVKWGKPKNFE